MLALKNRFHVVEASIPGLADFARVSLEKCVEALDVLKQPDPYSRSKENEGRRIQDVEGGWVVLNGEKYREKMSADERREANRIYQKRFREKQAGKVVKAYKTAEERLKEKGIESGELDKDGLPIKPKTNGDFEE